MVVGQSGTLWIWTKWLGPIVSSLVPAWAAVLSVAPRTGLATSAL